MNSGFELVDHTADVAVRAWGATAEDVFAQAASGMFSLICDPLTIAVTETVEVGVQAGERDLLLAAWLNELIYLFETRRVLFNEFEILEMDDKHLKARACGEALDPARHVLCGGVKAATLHQLSLQQDAAGWHAFVILDV